MTATTPPEVARAEARLLAYLRGRNVSSGHATQLAIDVTVAHQNARDAAKRKGREQET